MKSPLLGVGKGSSSCSRGRRFCGFLIAYQWNPAPVEPIDVVLHERVLRGRLGYRKEHTGAFLRCPETPSNTKEYPEGETVSP
jgi:hypothetical protein